MDKMIFERGMSEKEEASGKETNGEKISDDEIIE